MATTLGNPPGRATGATVHRGGRHRPACHNAPVKNILIRVVVNGLALWLAALVVPGVNLANGDSSWANKLLTVLFVALVFGVINAFIKPIVKLFSIPFIVLTLGLFTFIVNAFMLQITEWICDWLNLDFTIDEFFWDAVLAAVVITFVSWVLNLVLPDDD
jgi:putative membrane protein